MTALLRAIEDETGRQGRIAFRVDSTLAINVATGKWRLHRSKALNNRELARNLRRAYRNLCADRPSGDVEIHHVRAHAGTEGNEAADRLAKRGAQLFGTEGERDSYKGEECSDGGPIPEDGSRQDTGGHQRGREQDVTADGGSGRWRRTWRPRTGDG